MIFYDIRADYCITFKVDQKKIHSHDPTLHKSYQFDLTANYLNQL